MYLVEGRDQLVTLVSRTSQTKTSNQIHFKTGLSLPVCQSSWCILHLPMQVTTDVQHHHLFKTLRAP